MVNQVCGLTWSIKFVVWSATTKDNLGCQPDQEFSKSISKRCSHILQLEVAHGWPIFCSGRQPQLTTQLISQDFGLVNEQDVLELFQNTELCSSQPRPLVGQPKKYTFDTSNSLHRASKVHLVVQVFRWQVSCYQVILVQSKFNSLVPGAVVQSPCKLPQMELPLILFTCRWHASKRRKSHHLPLCDYLGKYFF